MNIQHKSAIPLGRPAGEPGWTPDPGHTPPAAWHILGAGAAASESSLTRLGPLAIRGAMPWFRARHLGIGNGGEHADAYRGTPRDLGDLPADALSSVEAACAAIEAVALKTVAEGGRLLALGGEHFITYPLVSAALSSHETLQVIHLDAHSDRYGSWDDKLLNRNVVNHLQRLSGVYSIASVGVREVSFENAGDDLDSRTLVSEFPGHLEPDKATEYLAETLSASVPVYITIDADVLDPGLAPEVAYPVAGGYTGQQLINIVRYVATHFDVVGADLVEVCGQPQAMNQAALVLGRCGREIIHGSLERIKESR